VKPRIVFMGSPEGAVPSLRAATRVGDVVGVFTQPDRPCGRGRRCLPPPVAAAALELSLAIHQPAKVRTPEVPALLAALHPDVVLVVAYGKILPTAVLECAPRGCVNVHFSLLPRHRGAAPVAHAILAGDAESGVTLMVLDEGMDTGPTLVQRATPIGAEETTGELTERLAELGASMVETELPRYLSGELHPRPQPAEGATAAGMLEKSDGAILWDRPAAELHRRIRAVTPWPGAYGFVDGRRWILHRTRILPHVASPGPGKMLVEGKRIAVGAADVCLELLEVQREGCRKQAADSFLAGCCPGPDSAIGPERGCGGG
jgi:methionyl-tRNA formyltransferase